ncbi:hypothetical protein ACLMJK_002060 [Lecanora helva]
MHQASLVKPVTKLDIKDLLKPTHSPPPPLPTQPSSHLRSTSTPSPCTSCDPLPSPSSESTISRCSAATAPSSVQSQCKQHFGQTLAQPFKNSQTEQAGLQRCHTDDPTTESTLRNKRSLSTDEETVLSGPKKSQKWSPAEDAKVIELRAKNMKWADISKEMVGRSDTSCRLHYQNYLEKRQPWDEEKRNKLARVYDRLKQELWTPIAAELGVPWRAAEGMHWQLGKDDMARRANVTPFSINIACADRPEPGSGRVAQRDRMLESTRVFEGQDLSTLGCPFNGPNGNMHGHHSSHGPPGCPGYSVPPPTAYVHIPPIKSEGNPPDEEEDFYDDEEEDDWMKVRKGKSGKGYRLPGLAEMDGQVQAIAQRERKGLVSGNRFEERRRSNDSGGTVCSSRSCDSR